MARFYGEVEGDKSRTNASREANSSIKGHIRGWDFGVRVRGYTLDDEDVFQISLTGGSNNDGDIVNLGYFSIPDLKREFQIKRF